MKLTTHLHLILGLRMRGDIPPLPVHLDGVVLSEAQETMSWCGISLSTGATLPFPYLTFLPPMPKSPKWSLPSGILTKILHAFLISPMCATCHMHLILHMITLIIFSQEYKL
jgi:hypothetical protein